MKKEVFLDEILRILRPGAEWVIRDNKDIEWYDEKQLEPSEEEIEKVREELEIQWKSDEYKRLRKPEYPSIEECVHAILDDKLEELQVKRKVVKDKYPKPELPNGN